MRLLQPADAPLKVMLSWAGYFRSFCAKHGQPMDDGVRLIFPDGWTYANSDYRGPETRPPSDERELRKLLLTYWHMRLDGDAQNPGIRSRHAEAVEKLRVLAELANQRDATLSRFAVTEVHGRTYFDFGKVPTELDSLFIKEEMRRLNEELKECEEQVAKLNKEQLV